MRFVVRSNSCQAVRAVSEIPAKIRIPVSQILASQSRRYQIAVSGAQTIVHAAESLETDSQLQIVVLPGNPGLSSFYVPYIEALHRGLESRGCSAKVTAITHKGLGGVTDGKIFNLQQQIEHKLAFLEEHVAFGQGPVVLIGHSIGAHMALQVAHAFEERQSAAHGGAGSCQSGARVGGGAVAKVILLHPFLAVTAGNPEQRTLGLLTAWPALMALLSAAVGALPGALKGAVVKAWAGDICPHALAASLELLTLSNARNCWYLGQNEFSTLPAAPAESWEKLRRLGAKAAVISKPRDSWFTDDHWGELLREVPGIRALLEDISHAFCTDVEESATAAQRTVDLLHDVISGFSLRTLDHVLDSAPPDPS